MAAVADWATETDYNEKGSLTSVSDPNFFDALILHRLRPWTTTEAAQSLQLTDGLATWEIAAVARVAQSDDEKAHTRNKQ